MNKTLAGLCLLLGIVFLSGCDAPKPGSAPTKPEPSPWAAEFDRGFVEEVEVAVLPEGSKHCLIMHGWSRLELACDPGVRTDREPKAADGEGLTHVEDAYLEPAFFDLGGIPTSCLVLHGRVNEDLACWPTPGSPTAKEIPEGGLHLRDAHLEPVALEDRSCVVLHGWDNEAMYCGRPAKR